jgi:hypothetical protein
LSFFDEDDEPPRTTSRTRTRSAPRPRRGTPAGGAHTDAQTVLIRRMIAFFGFALLVLFLGFFVHACNGRRHDNSLREYNNKVSDLATASRETGKQFFDAVGAGGNQSAQTLYGQIVGFKNDAETHLTQAQALSVPSGMKNAQESLLIALEMRRDGLTRVASSIKPALGDEGDAADQAIKDIAADMGYFSASDVLYRVRVNELLKQGLKGVSNPGTVETSQFLPDVSWLSSQYVATKLGQQLSTTADGTADANKNQTTGPGLHGTGLNATSYGNVTLSPTTSNVLTYVAGTNFTVSFTNQGDNDEFGIKVSLKINRQSGTAVTLNKTVPKAAKGEKVTVTMPLNKPPPLDTVVTIQVNVSPVNGEKKTDNNKASYPSVFHRG